MTNIFIANLDFGITSEDLKATFSQFGEVTYAHVVYDNKTKKSKGFGYVEMENSDQAIQAIEALNGLDVNGRAIDVKIASPKGNRPTKVSKPKKEFSTQRNERQDFSRKPREYSKSTSSTVKEEQPKRVMRPRRKRL